MTDSVPGPSERREFVADLDASIASLTALRDTLAHSIADLNEGIGKLAATRYQIMEGVLADEARARSSAPDGFEHLCGLADR